MFGSNFKDLICHISKQDVKISELESRESVIDIAILILSNIYNDINKIAKLGLNNCYFNLNFWENNIEY